MDRGGTDRVAAAAAVEVVEGDSAAPETVTRSEHALGGPPELLLVDSSHAYAHTLREWREAFNARWETIHAQGFDETFRRMWEFYQTYCEAGFGVGYIDVFQIQIQRPDAHTPKEV